MKTFYNLIILTFMLEYSCGDTSTDFLYVAKYETCEGKYIANYTIISQFRRDASCSSGSDTGSGTDPVLISCISNGQKAVNVYKNLAISIYPAGAYDQAEALSIIVSGPLQGNYLYEKNIGLSVRYLKKCSSVLGYSYVSNSKSLVLLIIDQLNFNALIAPTGPFHDLQKSASTICKGSGYIV